MIHLYCGNGKGKTTAGIGLIIRQLANEKKVLSVSFLKNGTSSELLFFKECSNITLKYAPFQKLFYFQMNAQEQLEFQTQQKALFQYVKEHYETYDCIFLDEIIDACNLGILEVEEVLHLIQPLQTKVEWILTGRNPHQKFIEISDYYTEFIANKHPYEKGIEARKGVEY